MQRLATTKIVIIKFLILIDRQIISLCTYQVTFLQCVYNDNRIKMRVTILFEVSHFFCENCFFNFFLNSITSV